MPEASNDKPGIPSSPLSKANLMEMANRLLEMGNRLKEKLPMSDAERLAIEYLQSKQGDELNAIGYAHTPLTLACKKGHFEVVKYLAEQPEINMNLPDKLQHTPLTMASAWGHVDIVQFLVEECDVDIYDYPRRSPSVVAAYHGSINVLEYLADACDLYLGEQDARGNTPLVQAVVGDQINVLRFLEELGFDLNYPNGRGQKPLTVARRMKREEIINYIEIFIENQRLAKLKKENGDTTSDDETETTSTNMFNRKLTLKAPNLKIVPLHDNFDTKTVTQFTDQGTKVFRRFSAMSPIRKK